MPIIATVFFMLNHKNEDPGLGPTEMIQQVTYIGESLLTLKMLTFKSLVFLKSAKRMTLIKTLFFACSSLVRKIQVRKQ